MERLHLTEPEARKMFREIDVDRSGEISRNEFVSAIGLSEPSLFLEENFHDISRDFHGFSGVLHVVEAFSPLFSCLKGS